MDASPVGKGWKRRGRKPVKSLLALPDGFVGIVLLTQQPQAELRGERIIRPKRSSGKANVRFVYHADRSATSFQKTHCDGFLYLGGQPVEDGHRLYEGLCRQNRISACGMTTRSRHSMLRSTTPERATGFGIRRLVYGHDYLTVAK
jgi:hypothetical protein